MDDDDQTIRVTPKHIGTTAEIIAAYVANNSLPTTELPALIVATYTALSGLARSTVPAESTIDKPSPAQIRDSITHEALISFEDGKPYKTLKRHLGLRGLTPEAYRAKWGLPVDYPIIAVAYSETRSALAKSLGLGQARRKAPPAPAPVVQKPKRAGRPRKAKELA